MRAVFVDAGAWIALVHARDALAPAAAAWYDANARRPLLTTNYVLDEAFTRLRYDAGLEHAGRLRDHVEAAIRVGRLERQWIDGSIEDEAWRLLERHAEVSLSFTDATSGVVAKRARVRDVFGFDGDFRAMGFVLVPGD